MTNPSSNQPKTTGIFNPFSSLVDVDQQQPIQTDDQTQTTDTGASTSADGGAMASTSRVQSNLLVGICSRCNTQMGDARISEPPDLVYYCSKCRITTPKTDEQCRAWDQQMRAGAC